MWEHLKISVEKKAWMLIKEAGCTDFKEGDAIISLHCNFFINNSNAKSSDIEKLINRVKKKVLKKLELILNQRLRLLVNKKFKNVLVVLGGTSGERAISLESGKACIKALKNKGYKVKKFDPKIQNFNLINKKKTEVIFNALHGRDGEDGVAQSYFEYLKIPYTHSGVISSFNAMNKIYSKEMFIKNRIKTPKFF